MRPFTSAILLLAAWFPLRGQDAVPNTSEQPIRVDVDVVNVLCTVRDHTGALATNLAKEDFAIREDGKSQEIRYFTRETDLPLTLGILVDMSGSVRRFVQAEKGAAESFLKAVLRPRDQALLVGFSSTVVTWQDFTSSPSELRATLEQMHAVPFRGIPKDGGPMPSTLLYDAVGLTATNRLQDIGGRKAMIVISDGVDIGSRQTMQRVIRSVQSANAIVYGICYPNPHVDGCPALQALAEPTGGRMFRVTPDTPLSAIFAIIEEELRSQYSLGYVSANSRRDGAFRKLQVAVRRRGFKVEVRKGYYASKRK